MKHDAAEHHPDVIEQFCGGAWYTPRDQGRLRTAVPWLLSACGAASFAFAATALVRLLGAS